jgi:hypothetical protein
MPLSPEMNWRLVLMTAGSFGCAALGIRSFHAISDAPVLYEVHASFPAAFVAWAFVIATAFTPIVCIVSLLRGWIAWLSGQERAAPIRLLAWPFGVAAVSTALYGLGEVL